MSEPQQPSPVPPPPVGGTASAPPMPPSIPEATPAPAPPGAYIAPVPPSGTDARALTTPSPGNSLGTTALVLALLAGVGSSALGGWAGFEIGRGLGNDNALGALGSGSSLSILTPVRDAVLWAEIAFWAGTVLGIAALVVGIVATARRRGRGAGIAAIVIAAMGPILFGIAVSLLVPLGALVGTSQPG